MSNESIRLPAALIRNGILGQAHFQGDSLFVDITDDHIRAIVERAKELGLIPISIGGMVTGEQKMGIYSNGKRFNLESGTFEPVGLCPDKRDGLLQLPTSGKLQLSAPRDPMPEIKFDAPPFDKSASPVDDDAIAQRIVIFLKEGWPTGTPALVRNLVAAIRRGEVTGLTTTAEAQEALTAAHAWADAEIKRLHVERDTLKAEVARLKAEVDYRREEYEKVIKSSKVMRDEMQVEVERLRAELVRESDMWKELRKHTKQDPLTPEIDRASAAVELIKRLREQLTEYRLASIKMASNQDAAIARAEAAEALLQEIAKCDSGGIYSPVPHGDMARVKNHLDKYGGGK